MIARARGLERWRATGDSDLDYSKEIVLSEFKKRGFVERVKEHGCHMIWRVL